ncbi:MAG: hypothetical protein HOC71_02290 [Candidatus Latescibacteria bacterium]|jgi:hypothetical protein|nr:hypothetical protein [Candidatus Latescibacterota bacterium]
MKIPDVSFGNNGIKNIGENNASGKASKKRSTTVDSVKLSGAANELEQAKRLSKSVEIEYPPRMELVKEVSERIERGAYNNELLDSVAEGVAESSVVKDVFTEVAVNNAMKIEDRSDKIEEVNSQVSQGYFDNSEIMIKIAERLIRELGLSSNIG